MTKDRSAALINNLLSDKKAAIQIIKRKLFVQTIRIT